MTATDELRKLLDERGIEYESISDTCTYVGETQLTEYKPGIIGLQMRNLTPEQAIAATLGCGKLTAEQVRELIAPHLDARPTFDFGRHGAVWRADFQAIADELNATLGRGECQYVIEDNMNESEGMGDVWFRCTNCDMTYDYYADDWLMKQDYCPHCGAKIRKAVKR